MVKMKLNRLLLTLVIKKIISNDDQLNKVVNNWSYSHNTGGLFQIGRFPLMTISNHLSMLCHSALKALSNNMTCSNKSNNYQVIKDNNIKNKLWRHYASPFELFREMLIFYLHFAGKVFNTSPLVNKCESLQSVLYWCTSPNNLTIGWQKLNPLNHSNATLAPQTRQARASGGNLNY